MVTKRRSTEKQFQTQLDRILWAAKKGTDEELLREMMEGTRIAKRLSPSSACRDGSSAKCKTTT
jgi:hypothetical protein